MRIIKEVHDRDLGVSAAVEVQVTLRDLSTALTEWDRRYREEPERFMAEARRLQTTTPEDYGDAAAPYLLALLADHV